MLEVREKNTGLKAAKAGTLFLLSLLVILAFTIQVSATTGLENYPAPFIQDGKFNAVMIVGDNAPSSDIISAVDIATGLQYSSRLQQPSAPPIVIGTAKLASEVADVAAQNSIIIGNPCNNAAAAKLLGNPASCLQGFKDGQAIIKLFEQRNGVVTLLVAGYSNMDTRRAARVLADYATWQAAGKLQGTEVEVTGTSLTDINVIAPTAAPVAPTPAPTSHPPVISAAQTCNAVFDQTCYDFDSAGKGYIFTVLGNVETSQTYTGVMIHYIAGADFTKVLSVLSITGGMEYKINASIENAESLADAAGNVQTLEFTPLITVAGKETQCLNKFVVKNIKTCSNKLEPPAKSEEKAPVNETAPEPSSLQPPSQGSGIKAVATQTSQVQFAQKFFKLSMIPYALLGVIVLGGLIFATRKFVFKGHKSVCQKCGSLLQKGNAYCQECGEKVK